MNEKTILLPPNPSGNGGEANYRLTVMVPKRRFLSYLRVRWWVVMVCLVLTIGTVLTYETLRAERFESFAQIYLSGNLQMNVGPMFNEESLTYYGTQIEILKSSRMQAAAYAAVNITLKPEEEPPIKFDVVQPLKASILVLRAASREPTRRSNSSRPWLRITWNSSRQPGSPRWRTRYWR